ncbi:hypothetical protein OIO90_006193 [Microbotryomycetes sp. JL221]|nr:hypothetical protein OIO90_006193 [Microbotryomycetes sp. JL221]
MTTWVCTLLTLVIATQVSALAAPRHAASLQRRQTATTCSGDQFLSNGACVNTCPTGFYGKTDAAGNVCAKVLRCNTSQFFDTKAGKCTTCTNNWSYAATCNESGPLTCKLLREVSEDGKACVCVKGRYLNGSGGCSLCSSWFARSATCTSDEVLTCLPTYEKINGRCGCKSGEFEDIDPETKAYVCKPCTSKYPRSKTCTSNRIHSCQQYFQLSTDKQSCGCPPSKILAKDGSCQYCSKLYKWSLECTADNPTKCRQTFALLNDSNDSTKKYCGCENSGETPKTIDGVPKCATCASAWPGSLTCGSTTALLCKPNFVRQGKNCKCPEMGFTLSQDGQTCTKNVITCPNDPNVSLNQDQDKCVCNDGYFPIAKVDGSFGCEPCADTNAKTCSQPIYSTSCKDDFELWTFYQETVGSLQFCIPKNACTEPKVFNPFGSNESGCACPEKFYDSGSDCQACSDPHAITCDNNDPSDCEPGYSLTSDSNLINSCQQCPDPNAYSCTNGDTDECKSGYVFNSEGKCVQCQDQNSVTCEDGIVTACQKGYHLETDQTKNVCVMDSNQTPDCYYGFIPTLDHKNCVCPAYTVQSVQDDSDYIYCQTCLEKFPGSVACTTTGPTSCGPNFTVGSTSCDCPSPNVLSSDQTRCRIPVTCTDPFEPNNSGTKCVCKAGTRPDGDQTTSCVAPYVLSGDSNQGNLKCKPCNPGQYYDPAGVCMPCGTFAKTCTSFNVVGPEGCADGLVVTEDGQFCTCSKDTDPANCDYSCNSRPGWYEDFAGKNFFS